MIYLRPRIGASARRRGADGNGISAGDSRIAEQIVVKVLAVAAEQAGKLVVLALGEVELGKAVGLAAKAAGENLQIVERSVLCALQRVQPEGLAENTRAGLQVHHRVVHGAAARDACHAAAKIDGLVGRISLRDRHRWAWRWSGICRSLRNGDARRRKKHGHQHSQEHCKRWLLIIKP